MAEPSDEELIRIHSNALLERSEVGDNPLMSQCLLNGYRALYTAGTLAEQKRLLPRCKALDVRCSELEDRAVQAEQTRDNLEHELEAANMNWGFAREELGVVKRERDELRAYVGDYKYACSGREPGQTVADYIDQLEGEAVTDRLKLATVERERDELRARVVGLEKVAGAANLVTLARTSGELDCDSGRVALDKLETELAALTESVSSARREGGKGG